MIGRENLICGSGVALTPPSGAAGMSPPPAPSYGVLPRGRESGRWCPGRLGQRCSRQSWRPPIVVIPSTFRACSAISQRIPTEDRLASGGGRTHHSNGLLLVNFVLNEVSKTHGDWAKAKGHIE